MARKQANPKKVHKAAVSRFKPCSQCGSGTAYEVCVKCAQRLSEFATEDVRATGVIPAPAATQETVERLIQMSFFD